MGAEPSHRRRPGPVACLALLAVALGPWVAAPGPTEVGAAPASVPAPVVSTVGSAPALGAPASVAAPIVGMAPTPTGAGYWLVASDGGIFSYGDAAFHGSAGALSLNRPIVGMAPTPTGAGYWLVASDGGIFSYGDAAFHGSAGALTGQERAVAIAGSGGGYLVATSTGRLVTFGPAPALGAPAGVAHPVVALAARPDGAGAWLVSQPAPTPRPSMGVPPGSGAGRRIVYDNTRNRVWLVRADETVERTYLVSGRRGVPAPGTYRVFSKSPVAWAGHDGITMRHMVRFARGANLAIGFHSIPTFRHGQPLQSEAELGQFRSSGCVRQSNHDAEFLYHWAGVGTTVVVVR
jgi:lipoprotein-anchoring transpeptidase ErfK/SrfK